jgi:hypothetical protein
VGGVGLSGTFVYLPAEGTVLSAGDRPISVEFFPGSGNYTRAIATVIITVTAAEVPPSQLGFKGFLRPVHNRPHVNMVAAGAAVPVRFSVEGSSSSRVLQPGFPTSVAIACSSVASTRSVEETADETSSSMHTAGSKYTYIWKTSPAWAGTCRRLVVTLIDGSTHSALFRFSKEQKRKQVKQVKFPK